MADNKIFQSDAPATLPENTKVATKEVSFSGDTADVQLLEIVSVTGTEGSRTLNEISDASGLKIQDGGNTITVDGTVSVTGVSTAANQSTANTALAAIQAAVEVIDNFISGSKGLVTEDNSAAILTAVQTIDNFISGARGLVTEDNSAAIKTAVEVIDNFISGSRGLVTEDNSAAALTALQLIDDVIATTGSAITAKGAAVAGTDGTNARILKTDSSGELQVDVLTMPTVTVNSHAVTNAGTFATQIDGTALTRLTDIETNTDSGAVVGNGAAATAQRVTLANDSTGIVALTTSTASIGKLAANSGVDIGDVDITSIAAGDNNIGNVDIVTMPNVTLAAGTNTNEVVGDVAHDAGIAGNPVTVSGVSINMDDTAPPNRVDAEADAVRLGMSRDGAIFAHPHGPQIWDYHLDTSTAQTDTQVHAATGSASLCLYVTDIVFSSDGTAAINLFFEEGATKKLGPYYLPAVAGGVRIHFNTPKKLTANTALTLTTSASHAHSVDVTGYVGQG